MEIVGQAIALYKRLFSVENLPDSIVGVCCTLFQTFDHANHFTRSGKPSNFGLGEHWLAVNDHVVSANPPWHKLHLDIKGIAQLVCQPGSMGSVVSYQAVTDLNFHLLITYHVEA